MDLQSYIRDIPDFPKPGILFKDITPILQNPEAFQYVIDSLAERYANQPFDNILAIESRGFIFASALAYRLNKSFNLIRKKGKLPAKKVSCEYALEYGTDTLEIHQDALQANDKVLIVDDLLATGGTAAAACELVEKAGAQVYELAFVIELGFLQGRERLNDYDCHVITVY